MSTPTYVGGEKERSGVRSAGESNRTSRPHILVRLADRAAGDRGDPRRGPRTPARPELRRRRCGSAFPHSRSWCYRCTTRRWFPFAGPAAYWLLAAGISFVDPLLIPYPESIFLIGLVAAFPSRDLRDIRRAGLGLAIVVGATATLVYNIPGHSVFQLVFIPVDFAVAGVAGFAVRTRVEQAEVATSHATQAEQERDAAPRLSPWPRSGCGSRAASCTTSSCTPSA